MLDLTVAEFSRLFRIASPSCVWLDWTLRTSKAWGPEERPDTLEQLYMQPSTRVSDGSGRMCYLGWACGPGHFLRSVPLNALSASTTAPLGLCVRGHIPACSLYYLFMDLLSASLSDCFLNPLMLSASSLIWRQAPEVHYLLCKELFFNLFSSRSPASFRELQLCVRTLSCLHDL